MTPLFTIAVTTFDRVELLKQTIASALSQTFADFELIIGNDNPTRELTSESLGFDDPRIRFINHPTNLGEFKNMNSLLELARGRYFTWIADDDEYAPHFLESVHDALEKYHYPSCVFTTFQLIGDTEERRGTAFSGETKLLSGREFLRSYLAQEIDTIGTMSVCETSYLKAQGGLGDVSADGQGFYCEYLQILRASTQEKICYIDEPLMHFRVHERSWSASLNTDLDQYYRAAKNLIAMAIDFFRTPQMIGDFNQNLTNLLRRFLGEFVALFRRGGGVRFVTLIKFFFSARVFVSSLRGSPLYWRAMRCLISAEVWLFWAVCKAKFLGSAPEWMIDFAYAVRGILFDLPRPERLPEKSGNELESRVG